MDSPDVMGDPEKLAESTRAYANLAEKLEKAYSKWTDLSAQIEKVEAELKQ